MSWSKARKARQCLRNQRLLPFTAKSRPSSTCSTLQFVFVPKISRHQGQLLTLECTEPVNFWSMVPLFREGSSSRSIGMRICRRIYGWDSRPRMATAPSRQKILNGIFAGRLRLVRQSPATVHVHHLTVTAVPTFFCLAASLLGVLGLLKFFSYGSLHT